MKTLKSEHQEELSNAQSQFEDDKMALEENIEQI